MSQYSTMFKISIYGISVRDSRRSPGPIFEIDGFSDKEKNNEE
jgi:hypothetical protein